MKVSDANPVETSFTFIFSEVEIVHACLFSVRRLVIWQKRQEIRLFFESLVPHNTALKIGCGFFKAGKGYLKTTECHVDWINSLICCRSSGDHCAGSS